MIETSPFFSVIVPIFNVEKYVRSCIDSVLEQSFEDYELILVNDGSRDSSINICKEYSSNCKVKIVNKKNGGLVSARKAGLSIAKGHYVICLDGDDYLEDNYLSTFFEIINEYKPEVVCCSYFNRSDDGKSFPHHISFSGFYDKERIEKEVFPYIIRSEDDKYFPPSLWAKAFQIDIYRKYQVGVDERISIGEDGACVIPLIINCESLFCLDECLYNYRCNNSSITKTRLPKSFLLLDKLVDYLKSIIDITYYDFGDQLNRKIVHDLFYFSCSQFYSKRKYHEICCSISEQLDDVRYKESIDASFFKGNFLASLMRISLKKKLYCLLRLYSIVHK